MSSDRRTIRTHSYSTCLALVWLLELLASGGAWAEEPPSDDWQIDTYIDLSGSTTYLIDNGKSANLPTIGADLGIELWAPESPVTAGVFANYELDPRSSGHDLWIAGSWANYQFGRWEVSTTAAFVDEGTANNIWMYAGELKFRPRPGHKLSFQALGEIGSDSSPAFEVAYRLKLSRSVYVSLGVGLGSNRFYDLAANTKIVWSVY